MCIKINYEIIFLKVYSFDPTMGHEDYQRTPKIQFFNLGIAGVTGTKKVMGKISKVILIITQSINKV